MEAGRGPLLLIGAVLVVAVLAGVLLLAHSHFSSSTALLDALDERLAAGAAAHSVMEREHERDAAMRIGDFLRRWIDEDEDLAEGRAPDLEVGLDPERSADASVHPGQRREKIRDRSRGESVNVVCIQYQSATSGGREVDRADLRGTLNSAIQIIGHGLLWS